MARYRWIAYPFLRNNAILKTFTYLASSTLLHNKDIIHNQQEIVEDMQGDLIKKNVQKVGPISSLIFRF